MKHEVTFLTVPRSLRKAVKKLVRVLMSPPKMHFVVNFVATEVLVWKKRLSLSLTMLQKKPFVERKRTPKIDHTKIGHGHWLVK